VHNRVIDDVWWHLDPHVEQGLEVPGAGLVSTDRILIQDCDLPCGKGTPSSDVYLPEKYTDFAPLQTPASPGVQRIQPGSYGDRDRPNGFFQTSFTEVQNANCTGENTVIDEVAAQVTLSQCFAACKVLDDCYGFSYASADKRCILQNSNCHDQVLTGSLYRPDYAHQVHDFTFFVKRGSYQLARDRFDVDMTSDVKVNTSTSAAFSESSSSSIKRRLLDAVGSTDTRLQYAPIKIHGMGKYRVCFCDSLALSDQAKRQWPQGQQVCRSRSDFLVDVGYIEVSGAEVDGCESAHHGGALCGLP